MGFAIRYNTAGKDVTKTAPQNSKNALKLVSRVTLALASVPGRSICWASGRSLNVVVPIAYAFNFRGGIEANMVSDAGNGAYLSANSQDSRKT